jgi:hypothetical protein
MMLLLLLLQVPLPVREAVYDIVAANRYSWFGRSKVCQVSVRLYFSYSRSTAIATAALISFRFQQLALILLRVML